VNGTAPDAKTAAVQTVPAADLGRTGLTTSALGVGTWGFGPNGVPETQVKDDDALVELLASAFAAGVRYLDTAESYLSEERIGRLLPLANPPARLLIASKCGRSGPIREGFTAGHFRRSAEMTLHDLRIEKLPLMLVHDPRTEEDMAEVMGPGGALEGLRLLQSEGLVGHIGIATGTMPPLWTAVRSGEFDVIQTPRLYTLLNTAVADNGLLAAAREQNMGVIIPAPFGGGILATGAVPGAKYLAKPAIPEVVDAVKRMEARCAELGVTLPAAALSYVLTEQMVDVTVVGMASKDEFLANLAACSTGLTRAELESIREAGRIDIALIGGPDFLPTPARS
jgi:D-threo-aldose 1-dehydrogenase